MPLRLQLRFCSCTGPNTVDCASFRIVVSLVPPVLCHLDIDLWIQGSAISFL